MRKQYDDFTQLKLKDMSKTISDMTYKYINPDTLTPTKVPPAHYEKILDQVTEKYMSDITSRQFLTVMFNQLSNLKKEDEKYFYQALLCLDQNLNPKDLRIDEQIAIEGSYNFIKEKQSTEKKQFRFLNSEIADNYNDLKNNQSLHTQIIEMSNRIDDYEGDDEDYGENDLDFFE